MRLVRFTLLAAGAIAAALASSPAESAIVTTTTPVPISSGALSNDNTLSTRVTNDLRVTVLTGADWTNSEILISLAAGTGSVYNTTGALSQTSNPNTDAWVELGSRQMEFDTFVTSKGFAGVSTAGRFPDEGAGATRGLSGNNAADVSVSWFNNTAGEDGTFTVGRFTLSNTAAGTFVGRSFDSSAPGVPVPFSGTIANGVMTIIPEPAAAGLLTLTALAGLAGRRRASRALNLTE